MSPGLFSAARGGITAFLLLTACSVPIPAPRPAGAPPPPTVESTAAETKAPVDSKPAAAQKAAVESKPVVEPKAAPPAAPAAPAKAPAKPASAAPRTPPAAPAVASPAASAARTPPPTLDLRTLEQRLKDSSAIGLMTKLSLKNQVDDLVAKFRTFHEGHRPPTIAELRPAFELLLMKVLSLLQDKDPPLAKDIDVSREAIWGVLTDREKLSQFL